MSRFSTGDQIFVDENMNSPENTIQDTQRRHCKPVIIVAIVVSSLIFITLLITLPVLFMIQRDVSFNLVPLNIDNSTINVTPEGFKLPVAAKVSSKNENYFNIYLDNIDLKATHPLYNNETSSLGYGNSSSNVLYSRKETIFEISFFVEYNRLNDPNFTYFNDLLKNCSNSQQLYFDVFVNVHYHVWAKSSSMNIAKNINIDCPISENEASRISSIINSGFF